MTGPRSDHEFYLRKFHLKIDSFKKEELKAKIKAGERILNPEKNLDERNNKLREANTELNKIYSLLKLIKSFGVMGYGLRVPFPTIIHHSSPFTTHHSLYSPAARQATHYYQKKHREQGDYRYREQEYYRNYR